MDKVVRSNRSADEHLFSRVFLCSIRLSFWLNDLLRTWFLLSFVVPKMFTFPKHETSTLLPLSQPFDLYVIPWSEKLAFSRGPCRLLGGWSVDGDAFSDTKERWVNSPSGVQSIGKSEPKVLVVLRKEFLKKFKKMIE